LQAIEPETRPGGAEGGRPRAEAPSVLVLRGLTRRHGGSDAVGGVDLELHAGELQLVVGAAGAGKTALLRLLAGFERPSGGEILIDGRPERLRSPRVAQRLGIGFSSDVPLPLEELSIAEHVILGAEPARAGCLRRRLARREVAALAVKLGLCNRSRDGFDVRARVGTLDPARKRQVELLGLAWRGAAVLLLDEPIAGLLPDQADRVLAALAALRADGRALLVATRAPERLLQLADRVTLLEDGRIAGTTPIGADERRVAALLASGQDHRPILATETVPAALSDSASGPGAAAPPPRQTVASELGGCKRLSTGSDLGREQMLQVKGLWVISDENKCDREQVAGLDLVVHRGEIHAVAAADGQGAGELIEAVLGLRRPDGGRIYLGDDDVTRVSVRTRRRHGLGYLPADELPGGLVGSLGLRHNALLGRGGRGVRRRAAALAAAVAPAPWLTHLPAWVVSRGDRQRLLLARELADRPSALLAVCPTRGLRRDEAEPLWQVLRAERDQGLAVLLWSADPEELIALADRVTVLMGGHAVAELAGPALTTTALSAAMHARPAPAPPADAAVEGAAAPRQGSAAEPARARRHHLKPRRHWARPWCWPLGRPGRRPGRSGADGEVDQ